MLLLAFQMFLLPTELPVGIVNKPYDSPQLRLTGGAQCSRADTSMRIKAGKLPAGVHLSTPGVFEGTPEEEGIFPIQVVASNGCGLHVTDMKLEVQGAPILDASVNSLHWKWKRGEGVLEAKELLVAGNWPGLAYRIDGAPEWLNVVVRQGRLPPKASAFEADLVSLKPKPDALAPGKYKATLIISAWGASRAPRVDIEIEVLQ